MATLIVNPAFQLFLLGVALLFAVLAAAGHPEKTGTLNAVALTFLIGYFICKFASG